MATPTYDLLDSTTLASSASSVTFSSISQDYRDLILVVQFASPGTSGSALYAGVRLNGDTGSNYSYVFMNGDGSSSTSGSGTAPYFFFTPALTVFDDSFIGIMHLMDYSATDKHTTALSRHNAANGKVGAVASRWSNTSAVTSVTVSTSALGGTFDYPIGSSFYLYGISA